ncbi:MAG TPA: hypothetical protein VKP65_07955 [Rhodothermales bacterium]|nr:hypothetical protein [Rhodothermales bacterium]
MRQPFNILWEETISEATLTVSPSFTSCGPLIPLSKRLIFDLPVNTKEDKHPKPSPLHTTSPNGVARKVEPGFPPDEPRPAIPLNEEQIAFYKDRMERGFYQSLEVREKIAARLINEVFQRPSK